MTLISKTKRPSAPPLFAARAVARCLTALVPGALLLAASGCTTRPPSSYELQLRSVHDINLPQGVERLDPSGLLLLHSRLMIVSDKVDSIYELTRGEGQSLQPVPRVLIPASAGALDLEDLAFFDNGLIVVSERHSSIFFEDGAELRPIWSAVPGLSEVLTNQSNAGLEGLAAGPDRQGRIRLFLAKERDPAALITMNASSLTPERVTIVDASDFATVALPLEIPAGVQFDISGLSMFEGHLYALSKNSWRIAKLCPDTLAVLAVARFPPVDRDIFDSPEPFGMAEGLAIDEDSIRIVFDNNDAARSANILDRRPLLAIFTRPPSF